MASAPCSISQMVRVVRAPALRVAQGERLLVYADTEVRDFLKRLDVFQNHGKAQ